jgi:hypothetical protein
VDTTFGTGGLTLITANQFPTGLGLDAAGDIFALPMQSQLQTQQGVTELSPAGQLDATVTPEPLTATSNGATFDPRNEHRQPDPVRAGFRPLQPQTASTRFTR